MAGNKRKASDGKSLPDPLPLFNTDDCPAFVPAAGYRNGTELNNRGANGNYWSSSLNDNNCNNAYNLNFNNGNYDWDYYNNNNRNNGHSVRPVSELAVPDSSLFRYKVSSQQLLADLYKAYKDARKNKRGKFHQLAFEIDFENELISLRDEIIARRYTPRPSTCFVINDPKKREIFAAEFRDRVVHHLYYNYTYELFERTFIADSYSCRKRKGTHYGFNRLKHHIRSVSKNYTRRCYVMKIDIMGYFMHIDRSRLLEICVGSLKKMAMRLSDVSGIRWCEKLDYDLLFYLSRVIIMNNPVRDCKICGSYADWKGLPKNKSLFYSEDGCGLPIGNLTSQLFSNVYMNVFDSYVKRNMSNISYGRYVDDAFFVSHSKSALRENVAKLEQFLRAELGLAMHPDKFYIRDIRYGIEFLGGYCKPFRCYVSNNSLRRLRRKVNALDAGVGNSRLQASVNSFLGVLSHYSTYSIRRGLFSKLIMLQGIGHFNSDFKKFIIKNDD